MTRAKRRVEGERCSRYFCNLEKRNFVEKTIPYLIVDDGRVIEDIKLNLSEQKEYYKNLYSSKQTVISQDNSGIFFDNDNPFLTKLFAYDSLSCYSKSDSDLYFSLFLYDEYEIVLHLIITFIVSHNNWSFIEKYLPSSSSELTENYVNKNNPKAHQKIHALMAELDLVDV
jgi:hypothetical protein